MIPARLLQPWCRPRQCLARPAAPAGALSLPNILTYGRILAVPAIVACYMPGTYLGRWLALAIFIAASVTDFFDGYLARVWQQQSAIGRMLDPIADKLLVATALLLLVSDNTIGDWSLIAAIIILDPRDRRLRPPRVPRRASASACRSRASPSGRRRCRWSRIGFLIAGPAGDKLFSGVTITDGIGSSPISACCCSGFRRWSPSIPATTISAPASGTSCSEEDVKLRYFAWVRERIGLTDEDVDLPADVATVDDLLDWLKGRGPEYEHALAEPSVIRVAIDHVHAAARRRRSPAPARWRCFRR